MENGASECEKESLDLMIKARRAPRFKAGADLSKKVNRVVVDLNEETTDDAELFELKLELWFEHCAHIVCE